MLHFHPRYISLTFIYLFILLDCQQKGWAQMTGYLSKLASCEGTGKQSLAPRVKADYIQGVCLQA